MLNMLPEDYEPSATFTNALNSANITEEMVAVFSKSTKISSFAAAQNQDVGNFVRTALTAFQSKFKQDITEFQNQCQTEAMKLAEQEITLEELKENTTNSQADTIISQNINTQNSDSNTKNPDVEMKNLDVKMENPDVEMKNDIKIESYETKNEIVGTTDNKVFFICHILLI